MRQWVAAQIGQAIDAASGAVVILDAEGALAEPDVEDLRQAIEVIRITDWSELRRVWDLDIRRRSECERAALLIVTDDFVGANDLPWDIEHDAVAVARVRWPVPLSYGRSFALPAIAPTISPQQRNQTPHHTRSSRSRTASAPARQRMSSRPWPGFNSTHRRLRICGTLCVRRS